MHHDKPQKWEQWLSLLTASKVVVKGEVIKEFTQMDTDFLTIISTPAYLLDCLCVSQGHVLPISTHWLELCSLIYSFIPQIFSEHLQHVRHLPRFWRYGHEPVRLPAFMNLPSRSTQSVRCVWAARAFWSLGQALCPPQPKEPYTHLVKLLSTYCMPEP